MKVLLIEDHPGLAKISCDVLREVHGHEVRHAPTAEAALKETAEFAPDVVLIDLNLPDMHGYRYAEQVRQDPRFDNTVLIALTGFGIAGDPDKSAEVGIDAHYRKPMEFDQLERIRDAARRSGVRRPTKRKVAESNPSASAA